MEVEDPVWNTFCYWHFFQFSTDFELFKRFQVKFELTKLWSYKLIATAIANPPELQIQQGLLHGDLQGLHYAPADMHNRSHKVQEVMEFQTWLIVKLTLEK